ncbi:outer membrane beta-barrel protein [Pseudoduganella ginsengisoli]|uniref:OmpW/AlkL family protein n=1 Tax=Pseudoduganella ginsengisoli TaxID=1462440 RepID=UPI0012D3E64A|nr:OmpW family outer membrane protein [Pseudoduganella ginsengisoli]
MNKQINNAVKLLALAAALGAASGASAQSAGQYTVKVGLNNVMPDVKSEPVSAPALPNSKADIGDDMQPIVTIARMLTDNISAEMDLGVPYKHKIYGAGALEGTGKMATSEVLPPTAFINYHLFQPTSMIRPYAGLGITYAMFRNETGSGQLTAVLDPGGKPVTFSMKNKWALSYKLGTTVSFKQDWFVDVNVIKTKLKTTATYSTGQTQVARLDPTAVAISIGHNFNWKW